MSLRARLATALTVVLLIVIGMAFAVVSLQRARLVDQLDDRLTSIVPLDRPAASPPPGPNAGDPVPDGDPRPVGEDRRQISDVFIAVVSPDGSVEVVVEGQLLDAAVDSSEFVTVPTSRSFSTVSATDGSTAFRVLSEPSFGGQATTIIAVPTTEIDQTIDRPTLTFAMVILAIAAILGVLAWWVWRLSLVPLARITDTADAIANGDRDQRVPELSDTTEAGRMARALNTMLDERDQSDDRLRQFVSDASHELRTPLTSIRGYLEIYAAGGFRNDGEMDDAVRRMTVESERMNGLVANLLSLARMEEGQQLIIEPTDVGELVRDVCADMGAAHPGRSVTADAPPSGRLIAAIDHQKVRQLLNGLIDNAMVHGPNAEVAVRARLDGNMLELLVADTGPGMTAEEADRVFDRFYRGDSSRSRQSGGSGLGLAIARMVAEQHGGGIRLTTAPGEGSTFVISLPVEVRHS